MVPDRVPCADSIPPSNAIGTPLATKILLSQALDDITHFGPTSKPNLGKSRNRSPSQRRHTLNGYSAVGARAHGRFPDSV